MTSTVGERILLLEGREKNLLDKAWAITLALSVLICPLALRLGLHQVIFLMSH